MRRIGLVESITPNVKQSSTDAELPRERNDVVARIHPFNGLPTKFVTVPLPLFSFHFAAPFPQSVLHQTVSLQGFTPSAPAFAKSMLYGRSWRLFADKTVTVK